MFAIAAIIVFIIGLVLELLDVGSFNWVLAFLGLALLAAHLIWSYTPWNRSGPG